MTDISPRVDHTAKAFDADLQDISRKVAEMGGLAERQIADATRALGERDVDLAERVIANDLLIDAMQHDIEEKAILTIARRQPMAVDLREIIGAMRVCNDLERIGDHAKHIGKRVVALDGDFYPQKLIRGVEHMSALVSVQLKQVLDAYAGRDLQAARVSEFTAFMYLGELIEFDSTSKMFPAPHDQRTQDYITGRFG